jgi:hypothetical protein
MDQNTSPEDTEENIEETAPNSDNARKSRSSLVMLILLAVVICFAAAFWLFSGSGASTPWGKFSSYDFVNGTGDTLKINYFKNSKVVKSNDLPSATQGGTKKIEGTSNALVSPIMAKYETKLFFMASNLKKNTFFEKDCTPKYPGNEFKKAFTVNIKSVNKLAAVCGSVQDGRTIVYFIQFPSKGNNYLGVFMFDYNYKAVYGNEKSTKEFLALADLTKYNADLKEIISSISVK